MLRRCFLLGSLASVLSFAQGQSSRLTAAQAKQHVGERATVCGNVVSTSFAYLSGSKTNKVRGAA